MRGDAPSERIFTADSTTASTSSTAPASTPTTCDGVTTTGVDAIDFWIGGLAEEQMPFGGLLGSTFNFVFETQLENLQNGDRFYYLSRTAGLNFGTELENNSFAQLVMLNTDATHLPADIFSTPDLHARGRSDEAVHRAWRCGRRPRRPDRRHHDQRRRSHPARHPRQSRHRRAPTRNYLQYTGEHIDGRPRRHRSGNDILIAGDGDDTVWGDGGNDRLEGGFGDDKLFGGDGDDIITDMGGNDVIQGGAGNDVIDDGHSLMPLELGNIILGGDGKDFIVTREDISTIFGGTGDDFISAPRRTCRKPATKATTGSRRARRTARPATTSVRSWSTTCRATTSSSAAAASTR